MKFDNDIANNFGYVGAWKGQADTNIEFIYQSYIWQFKKKKGGGGRHRYSFDFVRTPNPFL